MNRIIEVKALDNYEILVTYENGEKRIKDMKPYLEKGVFKKLKDEEFFKSVKLAFGTVSWGDEIDLCADSIYETSEIFKKE
ncbi:MAG: DUF2442 domain-containing protein [Clostridia bacterium]|nr:DUF2442 domain-containing protein [Clostridia bacterium]